MKYLFLLFGAAFSVLTLRAAEPWICTAPGTRFEYTLSVGGQQLGRAVKTAGSYSGGEVVLLTGENADGDAEHWFVYPDSTVLRMEATPARYALLESLGVQQPEVHGGSFALPAAMVAGQVLHDLRFSVAGIMDGEREFMSVEFTDCRVAGTERLTTPAGEFETVRVDMRNVTRIDGEQPLDETVSQWYARGVGLVRQETVFPHKDALGYEVKSVQELVKIVKP